MKRLLCGLLLACPVLAGNPLAVDLISDAKSIAPGETFHLGLRLTPPDGHHLYWKHPGAVGVATSIRWELPAGFAAGEIRWPAPEAVKMARYTAQGYGGETLLIVPVTPPDPLPADAVALTAKVSWMCCGERCHPASDVPFTLTLPVGKESVPDPATASLFEAYQAKIPRADPAWQAGFERGDTSLVLTLKSLDPAVTRDVQDLGELRFFTADGQIDSDRGQTVTRGPGQTLRIELPLPESPEPSASPTGVIVAAKGWRKAGGPVALEVK